MTLADCMPGDLLVIDENGDEVFVTLGAHMGATFKNGRWLRNKSTGSHWCLITSLDPDSLHPLWRTWRSASAACAVIVVIARATWLRAMRAINQRHPQHDGDPVDPVISGEQEAF